MTGSIVVCRVGSGVAAGSSLLGEQPDTAAVPSVDRPSIASARKPAHPAVLALSFIGDLDVRAAATASLERGLPQSAVDPPSYRRPSWLWLPAWKSSSRRA